jgi:hypothetical protein
VTGTLRETRAWCDGIRSSAKVLSALGSKHWDDLNWAGSLGRDELLRHVDAADLVRWSSATLSELDDFCVLVLFSVFEATVRDRVGSELKLELPNVTHPVATAAISVAIQSAEQGGFYRVLESLKSVDADLVEQVNQVRKYRNWVAHGRRGDPPKQNVSPDDAFDRLDRFLIAVDVAGG